MWYGKNRQSQTQRPVGSKTRCLISVWLVRGQSMCLFSFSLKRITLLEPLGCPLVPTLRHCFFSAQLAATSSYEFSLFVWPALDPQQT